MAPHVRHVVVPRAALAFDAFLTERNITNSEAGRRLGVTHVTVGAWRKGEKPPNDDNQERIELFCAVVDPTTNRPVKNERGHWVSHCPREWWKTDAGGDEGRPTVEPYDARHGDAAEGAPCAP